MMNGLEISIMFVMLYIDDGLFRYLYNVFYVFRDDGLFRYLYDGFHVI